MTPEEPKSDLPDIIAQLDQLQTGMRNFSVLLADYYQDLLSNRVPPKLAADLTRDYQQIMLNQARPK